MEILAPAGSRASLIAAVQSGADAVYIGGSKFSARQSAKNFTIEQIKEMTDYCHVRGVALHVAANTLVKETEKEEFLEYIKKLNTIGIDALIIQDIGMASVIRKVFPDLPLHASTQMSVASLDGVKYLEELGFSRVVLSRELSLSEIEKICKNSNIEIEVFAHGAICMCYSGQCLMSSIIGGRSGNRGMCAQPCRLEYEITNGTKTKKGYLLSPKDMCLVNELDKLKNAGVASLKIEGRLKRAEYVATVAGVYSKYKDLNQKVSKEDFDALKNAFNRSGFTDGYFKNLLGKEMMSIKNPGNVSENIFSPDAIRLSKEDSNEKKVDVDIFVSLKKGLPIEIVMTDSDFNSVSVKGDKIPETPINTALTKERLKEQILKLGNTPFSASSIEINLDDDITLPISEINNVRRQAVSLLEEKRAQTPKRREFNITKDVITEKGLENKVFSAVVKSDEQANAVLKYDIPIIYAPEELSLKIKKSYPEKTVITLLPPMWKEAKVRDFKIADGVSVSNLGQVYKFKDKDCYGTNRLNVFNQDSVLHFKHLKSLEISPELNLGEIKRLKEYVPLEVCVYGRIPLMVMENCPKKAYLSCKDECYLIDRYKEKFPLLCADGCYSEIYNSKPLYMADKFDQIKKLPISIYKLNFTVENGKETQEIIQKYFNGANGIKDNLKMPENTFTRGHYLRGVE